MSEKLPNEQAKRQKIIGLIFFIIGISSLIYFDDVLAKAFLGGCFLLVGVFAIYLSTKNEDIGDYVTESKTYTENPNWGFCPKCLKKLNVLVNKCPYCTADLNVKKDL